ncbi:MAG: aldehyde dehydrogenase family protein [Leptolyngbya sp. PLA2]|nr:aldehyde dehydrogenase family protein [Leptolyngbya sp.]MCE7970746.1 aldehyde dehydrogenase family protein [Leptolyngbya sp. PL-A2]MCQ3939901.1 L-glutamate gamma-semialdehyde dehydrogenase [cyanobacterium CYA1]MDL1903354.1 aldehyde dehydrogenase family protein [Synechococcales cyanobacterium CNB]GIK18049.1 MAG: bifunctional protein PutA [Planctomycetota bacterium]
MSIFRRKSASAVIVEPPPPTGGEERTYQLGRDLLERARGHRAGLLSAKFYSDKLMDWSMRDRDFKVQLFRFVDAFPMLRTPDAVHDHLVDYLSQPGVKLPPGMDLGLRAGGVAKGLLTSTVSSQIKGMASKFIAGADAASALPGLRDLWKEGIAFSVDLLGEACVSDAEADAYRDKYLDLVTNLPGEVASWKPNPRLESDHLGGIPRTNVSIKVSSLSAKCDPIDTEGAIRDSMTRIVPILEAARERGVLINFDMEQHSLKDLTIELFMRCCEAVDFHAGLAMQAYLKSGVEDARRVCDWAKRTGRVVTVRLVKGAYWDFETIHAEQQGWPCPVWNEKWQTDRCFEEMTGVFLDACPRAESGQRAAESGRLGPTRLAPGAGGVKLALGSHNVRSIASAISGLERRSLPTGAIELQMLHGMADQLKHAAAETGLRIREYVPVGEMIPGMAYLVRRLLENTSNESWLKAGFLDNADPRTLLREPAPTLNGEPAPKPNRDLYELAPERHRLSHAEPGVGDGKPFINEPLRDFSRRPVRENFAAAVAGATVPNVANDRTPTDAARMVESAHRVFPAWRDADPTLRARVLVQAAAAMRARRDELAGIVIKENGKCWRDADADVAEAIDFCEYYAREAVRLFRRERIGRFIGELDEQWYQPRGVAAVISPWNFPLAISCGMATAALVTGNPVVLKPAEQTPGIAKTLCEVLWRAMEEAGVRRTGVDPTNVLHFCPAPGETTGAALVRDPRVAVIAFTGSKAVGLDIIRAAGVTPEEQPFVKRVVCEMGGKNAIIIDTSADLDEAVLGVRHSAFGFQGQKCSACSRCIVVDPEGPGGAATRTFVMRLVEATRSLVIGDPTRPGTDIGPVIDEESAQRIRRYIETARLEGCCEELSMDLPAPAGVAGDSSPRVSGLQPTHYVGPHIFSRVEPRHTIAREEIFGPVLAVMHARTFDQALAIANDHPYKLTGGVFSRKPAHLELAKREFRVGNLYLNRGCTGALVARQPFGGFGMSGVGSKAGGRDYLLQFVEPRATCENTMRRGFAPEL